MRSEKHRPHYTVDDYLQWEGDWELIDGLAYAMAPSPSLNHQNVAGEVYATLRQGLKNISDCGNCKALYELDWHIDKHTVLRPDIVVVCNETEKFISKVPAMVVEVLSAKTAIHDRNLKFEIYEENKVPYYIIVEPESKQFSTFVLTEGQYKERNDVTVFNIAGDNCVLEMDLAQLLSTL